MTADARGQQTLDELAKQQQVGMMHAAQVQFITLLTQTPPPSKMPREVRRHMWRALEKTRSLFAPQGVEDEQFYAEPEA
jgi:hypothetical protein